MPPTGLCTLPSGRYSQAMVEAKFTARTDILVTTAQLILGGGTVSLESAARAAGLSRSGLLYHFSTKEALMMSLVDFVIDGYEKALTDRAPLREALSAEQRLSTTSTGSSLPTSTKPIWSFWPTLGYANACLTAGSSACSTGCKFPKSTGPSGALGCSPRA